MNKSDLITKIAGKMELSLSRAERIVSVFLEGIANTLEKGETVTLVGFGRFGVKDKAERKVKNPRTGVEMQVKKKRVPFFKAGRELKEIVDN